jgi:dimethylamine corrinoid protein
MRTTVSLLKGAGDPQIAATPVIIGGNQLNEQVCQYIGADAWVTDAMSGVRLCQKLITGPAS